MYNRVELRVILIGDTGVGKKSIVRRFKMLNSSETKIFSTKEETNKNIKAENAKNSNILITDSQTKKEQKEKSQIEIDDKYKRMKIEEKRIELKNFSLIYKIRMNYFEVRFFPCIEAIHLDYDYESKEDDDELLELEKQYKFSLRPLIKEIKEIILSPAENPNNQIEFLFLLCFDLSNFDTFEKLLIYFKQVNRLLKISDNFKICLIGNKMDKKLPFNKEDKDKITKFKNDIKANYYEISTMMFYPFDKFFETIILDNFKNLPMLDNKDDKTLFHETLMKKNNFSKAERKVGQENGISGEIKFKYNKDKYEYPSNIKDLMKVFQDPDKFNKNIFLTKIGAILPPIKKKLKDKEYISFKADHINILSKYRPGIIINTINKKVKDALELTSRKPGYSFGLKNNVKSLNLKKQRKALSEARYSALDEFMSENNTKLYSYKKNIKPKESKGMINQDIYEKNRIEMKNKKEEEYFNLNEEKKKRHIEIMESNENEKKKKIDKILEKTAYNDKKYLKEKKSKENKRMDNIMKNNLISLNKSNASKINEPKAKFYTPKSFISTNKGFTFGRKNKNYDKIKKVDYPDFPLFKDDFEKILLKNNFILHKSISKRFPENKTEEFGDDKALIEKQKRFEEKRELNKKNKTEEFKEKRKDWKERVDKNKNNIKQSKEAMLDEYIRKTYNGDDNYFKKEINYNQVENSSPKYSFREKTFFGSIFSKDCNNTNNDLNESSTKINTLYLENPDIQYTHMKFPKFSFGKSKRFNATSENFQGKSTFYNHTDYSYTQSFLKAETFMGTAKKSETKDNGVPGPNVYKIKRFADDVVEKGNKVNLNKIRLKNIDNFLETK